MDSFTENQIDNLYSTKYLIYTIAFIIVSYFLFFFKSRKTKLIDKFPGPKTYPIFGNAVSFFGLKNEEILPLFGYWMGKHGKTFRLWFLNKGILIVGDAKNAERILSSNIQIEKSEDYEIFRPWLGNGLLTSKGKSWTKSRKMLTPTFHFKILNDFLEIFNEQSQTLIDILKNEFSDGSTFNIFPFFTRCALDTICESSMGIKFNGQKHKEIPFLVASHDLTSILQYRLMRPWAQNAFIWKLYPESKREKEILKIIHGFTDGVIQERKKDFEENRANKHEILSKNTSEEFYSSGKKRLAFMDLLLESQEKDKNITDQDIRDQTSTFMFAGHDTTAVNMSWTVYLMGRYPDIQNKLIEELDGIFGDDKDRPVTQDDLVKMKYMELCIKESLRLYPSAPSFGRNMVSDFELEDGLIVPKGSDIGIYPFWIHRDPEIYPEPEIYKPDRFLPENSIGRNPYAYVPFSAGPRNCIGQKFAILEEKVMLSNFFRNFKVESIEKQEDMIIVPELILKPKNGINVKIFPRN